MTYYEAAHQVLRAVRQPLTTREITNQALEKRLITPHGKTHMPLWAQCCTCGFAITQSWSNLRPQETADEQSETPCTRRYVPLRPGSPGRWAASDPRAERQARTSARGCDALHGSAGPCR
jgi:hypothetical protein